MRPPARRRLAGSTDWNLGRPHFKTHCSHCPGALVHLPPPPPPPSLHGSSLHSPGDNGLHYLFLLSIFWDLREHGDSLSAHPLPHLSTDKSGQILLSLKPLPDLPVTSRNSVQALHELALPAPCFSLSSRTGTPSALATLISVFLQLVEPLQSLSFCSC